METSHGFIVYQTKSVSLQYNFIFRSQYIRTKSSASRKHGGKASYVIAVIINCRNEYGDTQENVDYKMKLHFTRSSLEIQDSRFFILHYLYHQLQLTL